MLSSCTEFESGHQVIGCMLCTGSLASMCSAASSVAEERCRMQGAEGPRGGGR